MSELTRCNYCMLQDIKRRNKGKKVTLKLDKHGWLEVFVDGESAEYFFKEVSKGCVC